MIRPILRITSSASVNRRAALKHGKPQWLLLPKLEALDGDRVLIASIIFC